ncbi:MAG: hypothetical protein WA081_20115 [Desulfosalsimonadaceae bacterium]
MQKSPILYITLILLLLSAVSVPASENQWELSSETIIRTNERQDAEGKDNRLFPVYEYLTTDYGRPLADGLTFHAHGWGRHDLSGSDVFDDGSDGELLYGYLGYTFAPGGPRVKLGRQSVFTGLMDERIDGLSLQSPFSRWMTLSVYGGAPAVDSTYDDRREQRVYGSRLGFDLGDAETGLSFQTIQNSDPEDDKKLGVDLYALLPADIIFSGFSSLNLVSSAWAEHSYELQFMVKEINIKPMYQRVQFQDLFDEGSLKSSPFRFLGETDEVLTVAGGDVSWQRQPIEIGAQVKNYAYDQKSEANLYSAGFLNWTAEDMSEVSFECGLMNGDAPQNRFILGRTGVKVYAIPLLPEQGHLSGDIIYVNYNEPIYEQKDSITAVLSYSHRFFKNMFEIIISGDYGKGPYYDQDVGASLILVYDGGSGALGVQP